MKLFLTSRLISGFVTCDVYDDTGLLLYVAREQSVIKECLEIYDSQNIFLGSVKEDLSIKEGRKEDQTFLLWAGEVLLGTVRKEFPFWKLQFASDNVIWTIEKRKQAAFPGGYTIFDENQKKLASVSVKGADMRIYTLELETSHGLFPYIMAVLAIELSERCKSR